MSHRVWLFDLGKTLHDATPPIFPHIDRSIREYVEQHLGVDHAETTRIRQDYWNHYGATVLGLVRHHDTDPRHFLRQNDQFEKPDRMVVFDHALRGMLRRLPGRKIVFSNARAIIPKRSSTSSALERCSTPSAPSSDWPSCPNRCGRPSGASCVANASIPPTASSSKTVRSIARPQIALA